MKTPRLSVFLNLFVAFCCVFSGVHASSAALPGFTLSATDVTMPSSGNGMTQWTVTSINGYSGALRVACKFMGTPPQGVPVPSCTTGVIDPLPLSANETLKGGIPIYPPTAGAPVTRRSGWAPGAGTALAGVLLLGLGFRRRAWRSLASVAIGAVALVGISACGGQMMPTTYPYTITAMGSGVPDVSVNITVTVP